MTFFKDADELAKAFAAFAESGVPDLQKAFRAASCAAPTVHPVLVIGPTGSGKELVARGIHELSYTEEQKRSGTEKLFVAVNCANIPHDLAESFLFGHEKGAFTGANGGSLGFFREAEGGTLFLDEIGELPLALQAKLLRVLAEKKARSLGGKRDYDVSSVRIIAATNRDLQGGIKEGSFREDLYHRLSVFKVLLPALKSRGENHILGLARMFLNRESNGEKTFSEDAERLLVAHAWPGNVRELENVVIRAAALSQEGTVITAEEAREALENDGFESPSDSLCDSDAELARDRFGVIEAMTKHIQKSVRTAGKGGDMQREQILQAVMALSLTACGGDADRAMRALCLGEDYRDIFGKVVAAWERRQGGSRVDLPFSTRGLA